MNWIMPHLGPLAVGAFVDHLTGDEQNAIYIDSAKLVLENIAKYGGDQAKPGLLTVLDKCEAPSIRAAALGHLVGLKDRSLRETLEAAIEKGMTGDARDAARFAVLAAQFADGRLRERLWQDLSAKSKLRRDAAAEAMASGDAGRGIAPRPCSATNQRTSAGAPCWYWANWRLPRRSNVCSTGCARGGRGSPR